MLIPYNSPPINQARLLLSHVRGGDYAHAGDREAIDLVIEKTLELSLAMSLGILDGPTLDLGSGFGGTADYLVRQNFQGVFGVDIDGAAVDYAQKKYPHIPFTAIDAMQVSSIFDAEFFSFISLFNVIYAIEDKKALLHELFKVAKPGAILALFDYTTEVGVQLTDLAGKPMYPIILDQMMVDLVATGWEIVEVVDLTTRFLTWYGDSLRKIEGISSFSEADISKVKSVFTMIYDRLGSSEFGGTVIYAKRV